MYEELIVSDVAVDESVTLLPATKFANPKGTYPNAFVMFAALKAVEFRGVYPRALIIFTEVNAAELNGTYPRFA